MSVQSYARLCPVAAVPNAVQLNTSIQEITLHPQNEKDEAKSWIVDNIVESQDCIYAKQEDVWRDFLVWLNNCSDAAQLTCMSLGAARSGKSYTLFGSNTSTNRGLIPRLIEHAFIEQHAYCIELSMCLCRGEVLIDALDPPASYTAAGNCLHSTTIGPCMAPLKVSVQGGVAATLRMLRLGYMSASLVMMNTSDAMNCGDLITILRVGTPQKRYSITFIDANPLIFQPLSGNVAPDAVDRLSGMNLHYSTASALADCGFGIGASCSTTARIRDIRKQPPYERSLMSYLLQDTLLRAQHTLIIGHLRCSSDWFHENMLTLSFLESIHDACEVIKMAEVASEIITCFSPASALLHSELEHLCIQIKDANAPEQASLRAFLIRKHEYLEQVHNRFTHSANAIRNSMEDYIPVVRWLKHRGITSAFLDTNNTKSEFAGAWSMSEIPDLSQPVLIPVVPSHFIDLHVHFPINVGHTAFCGKEIYVGRDIIGARFDKIFQDISNNCRVYPLGTAGVKEAHAVIFRMGSEVKIRCCGDASVAVNGVLIPKETILSDGDVITFGVESIFVLHVPASLEEEEDDEKPNVEASAISFPSASTCFSEQHLLIAMQPALFDIVSHALTERNICAHYAVQRDMISITRPADMTEDMKLMHFEPEDAEVDALISHMTYNDRLTTVQVILASHLANFYATELGHSIVYEAQLRMAAAPKKKGTAVTYSKAVRRIFLGKYTFTLDVVARGTNSDGKIGTGGWTWNFSIFSQRIFLMDACYERFLAQSNGDLDRYEESVQANTDPFIDPTDFELIGVSYIHLDSLNFLLDVNDTAPIITFKGTVGGAVKLSLRCWIDKVEPVPSYISVDKESVLNDFLNRKCIIRLHIDSCQGINAALSTEVYCAFKFFCHSSEYRTTRVRSSPTPTPFLNTVVVLEQLITPEFISYIQRRSLELEIYGCRSSTVSSASSRYHFQHFVGETTLQNTVIGASDEVRNICKCNNFLQSVGSASIVDDASSLSPAEEVEVLRKEVQQCVTLAYLIRDIRCLSLTELLNQTEKSNRRATRVVDSLKTDTPVKKGLLDEKKRLEAKLSAEVSKTLELEQRLLELQENIQRAEEIKENKVQKSRACLIS